MKNWFTENDLTGWDRRIDMRSIIGELDKMELTQPLPCGNGKIPPGFVWNGSGAEDYTLTQKFVAWFVRKTFPKWKHPIASCRHDWRCMHATNDEERLFADKEFRNDVSKGGTKWECFIGYLGVRAGAYLKIGSNF